MSVRAEVHEYIPPAGPTLSAGNGIYIDGTTIKLGVNPLVETTVIDTNGFQLQVVGSSSSALVKSVNYTSGEAFRGESDSGPGGWFESYSDAGVVGKSEINIGVYGISVDGAGVFASSTNNIGVIAISLNAMAGSFNIYLPSDDDQGLIMQLTRGIAGGLPGVNGVGGHIDFVTPADNGFEYQTARLGYKMTDVTTASFRGAMVISAANLTFLTPVATFEGHGEITFHGYGVNTFTGTVAYYLAVTAAGKLIETTAPGGGGITLDPVGSSPNADGATLTGSVLNLEPASASFAGVATPNQITDKIGIGLDGSGSVITIGSKGKVTIPYDCEITHFYLSADISGSIQFDLKVSGTSIVGGSGNKPALVTAVSGNAAPASWTSTSIPAGTILEFVVDSASTLTICTLVLKVIK